MPDSELDTIPEKSLDDLKKIVALTYRNLEKISRIVENIDKEKRKEMYKSMPGVSGYFDGFYLVGDDGSKYEVPANYAAKSRIVHGDSLKMLDEDGKKLFKQIDKVPRKKIVGVLSKKEGKWYFLSDDGTYRISDTAADFHKAELNDKAVAYIPENNLKAEYAALDYLEKEKTSEEEAKPSFAPASAKPVSVKNLVDKADKIVKAPTKKPTFPEPAPAKPAIDKKPSVAKSVRTVKPAQSKPVPVKNEPKTFVEQPKPEKEFVANIMEEDDLR